jgi:hypothetical protein
MAAKRTSGLIPLCHPIAITGADIAFLPMPERDAIRITATVKTEGKTGVEMEALTAVSIAALTIYDMVKALDKGAVIESTRLVEKTGGKSGDYKAASPKSEPPRKSAAMHAAPVSRKGERPRPATIMGEVIGPRAEPDSRRDAFQAFMARRRLRPTQWARDAGIPLGEIMSFLTGRSRGFSADTEARLAAAAKVAPGDMYR